MKVEYKLTGKVEVDKFLMKLLGINTKVNVWANSNEPNDIMQQSFEKNFDMQGRPTKWEKLAQKTINIREHKGFPGARPVLVMTGNFMDEITNMRGDVDKLSNGVSVSWGEKQLRGESKEKLKAHETGVNRQGNRIPKRHVLLIQKKDSIDLSNSLKEFLMRQFA